MLDRHGEWRERGELARVLAGLTAVVLDVHEGRCPVVGTARNPRLHLIPGGRAADADDTTFLGVDPQGRAVFARHRDDEGDLPAGSRWAGLREVGLDLPALDREILTTAVALDAWHRSHTRCPRCGGATVRTQAGWVRRCAHDGTDHYPRTDPAIIVLVVDADDRALLARQSRWPPGWMSTLAGFVEPGESAEAAVHREVGEEVGIALTGLQYVASQPWPFPASLMLGFRATARSGPVRADGIEIAEARWFSRPDLAAAGDRGDVLVPPALSIAHRLIRGWYGAPLPAQWSRPAR